MVFTQDTDKDNFHFKNLRGKAVSTLSYVNGIVSEVYYLVPTQVLRSISQKFCPYEWENSRLFVYFI